MVDELTNGTAIAMEIKGENVHSQFREFVGPHDPVNTNLLKNLFYLNFKGLLIY